LFLVPRKFFFEYTAILSDRWQWQPDPEKGYSVRGAYELMTSHDSGTMDAAHDSVTMDAAKDLIWHPLVPLKVSIFTWRLLCDRLPTKQTWFLDTSYHLIFIIACLDAERSSRPYTYSPPAGLLVLFGLWSAHGLAFHRWTLILCQIT
jgi:hypothetical protein